MVIFAMNEISYDEFITGDKFKLKYLNNFKNVLFSKIDEVLSTDQKQKYKFVITHNGDLPVTDLKINAFPNLIQWFGQNVISSKAVAIPIGLENDYISNSKNKKNLILEFREKQLKPNHLIYSNFNIDNNIEERSLVYNYFSNKSWCTTRLHNTIDIAQYFYEILNHKFIVCPIGGGLDCHRNWEVLYLNRFPIMKKIYSLQKLYEDLPVLFVDDWNEITESFLENKYKEMLNKKYNYNKLLMSYWTNLIDYNIKTKEI